MGIAVMKGLRFAGNQESCLETWKRSHMVYAALLCGRFDDAQKSLIQVAKRSNVSRAVIKGLRFADSQELRFQGRKRNMGSAVQQ